MRFGSGCGGSSDKAMWTRVCAIVSASAQGRPTFFSACVSRTVTATSGVPLPRLADRRHDCTARPPGIGVDEPAHRFPPLAIAASAAGERLNGRSRSRLNPSSRSAAAVAASSRQARAPNLAMVTGDRGNVA